MSAILGRIHFSGAAVDPQGFNKALATLSSYGREGANMWVDGPVALGHQHLDIMPESVHEMQPLAQGGLIIVADAILDNRDALCDQLYIDKSLLAEIPDSQIILSAYRRWGEECASRLEGDFTFGIWDAHKQSLLLARDHIGARPLYFYRHKQCFLFSTDIRGLLAFQDIHFAIDESRVASYLVWPLAPDEDSFFQGVKPVAPGHYLVIDKHRLQQQAHWHPLDVPDIRYQRRETYDEHLRELLEAAVSCRLRTSFPVASHLSGGLDSSGVTILASRLLHNAGRQLDMTYTWSPAVSERYPMPDNSRDERRVIADICRKEGIECHYGTATGRDYRDFLTRDIAVEGTTDLFEELPVMAHAGQRGTRVMLSGWGGDESVTFNARGYPSYLLKRGRLMKLLAMARKVSGGFRHPDRIAIFLWQHGLLPIMPDAVYARYTPYLRTDRLEHFIHPDLKARFPNVKNQRMLAWRDVSDPTSVQALLLQNGHLASRMATWAHWSAPQGLVYRYPLTDIRLLRFTLGLPPDLMCLQGITRTLYRKALGDLLPVSLGKHDVTNEKKRLDCRMECWHMLAQEALKGYFSRHCHWLDIRTMQSRIVSIPVQTVPDNSVRFFPLQSSMRVWHLWHEYGFSHTYHQSA
ncbi:asparagine synthase-related protein [Halomonas kalidii]|uniref:asparagine synthase (glutamine-hydrolyzing) n=1 Tax=Halomonas kalidii TaxID=3043293 RepID=A0ABT6VJM8_9GAMM|nr:asparagine synthase-related protein [Halomonas kalidii]MDI5934179.1 asparagine synthase-related protein [Halomonas kalidii]